MEFYIKELYGFKIDKRDWTQRSLIIFYQFFRVIDKNTKNIADNVNVNEKLSSTLNNIGPIFSIDTRVFDYGTLLEFSLKNPQIVAPYP